MAIVVTYYPDEMLLCELLRSLLGQVETVVVVDNTPSEDGLLHRICASCNVVPNRLRVTRLGENRGIAAALNVGIDAAILGGYDYVLLSDQDSLPAPDMVGLLTAIAERLSADGVRVGSVSPTYVDRVTQQAFPFQVQEAGRWFYSSVGGQRADPWIEILTAITSGTLIPCSVFSSVGMMREDLFIDDVDIEWGHRARYHRYSLFGTSQTCLSHHLGDDVFQVWVGRWQPFNSYSPLRLYYRFRNFMLLCRYPHVDWRWKVRAAWFWLGNAYAYLVFSRARRENARMILRGLADGLLGRSGPYVAR